MIDLIRSRTSRSLGLATLLLHLGVAGAQEGPVQEGPAYLVADLRQESEASRFNPEFYAELDGRLYFAAYTSSTGHELFRTDGTPAGTELVADLCAGACSSQGIYSHAAAVFEDELYFAACAVTDCRLWRTAGDGAVPVFEALVRDIVPYQGALYVTTVYGEVRRTDGRGPGTLLFEAGGVPFLFPAEDRLYVWAVGGGGITAPQIRELWHTDGTAAGSHLIRSAGDLVLFPFVFDGRAVFSEAGRLRLGGPSGSELLLADSPFTNPAVVDAVDGLLFVRSDSRQLWRTDGTAAGTVLLGEADQAEGYVELVSRAYEGELYFAYGNPSRVLYRTTGGVAQTAFYEFPEAVRSLDVVDGTLYVGTGSRPPMLPSTLWRVDGDAVPPSQVLALADGERVGSLLRYRDGLVFERLTVNGYGVASQLAFVDEEDGEVVVLGWRENGSSSDPQELTRDRHQVLFRRADTFRSWVSNGTPEGTFPITGPAVFDPIVRAGDEAFIRSSGLRRVDEEGNLTLVFEPPAGEIFVPDDAVVLGGGLLLLTETVAGHVHLYLADRDSGTLELLAEDLHRFTGILRDRVQSAPLDGAVLLVLDEQVVWRSDGTPGGTWQVLDVPEVCECTVTEPVRAGSSVYMRSLERGAGPRLWRSDGTPEGTVVVREFPSDDEGVPVLLGRLASAGDRLFFVLDEPSHGAELWTSDGRAEGTVLVRDVKLGEGSSHPRGFTAVEVGAAGGKARTPRLFFSADDGVHGRELWTSDGSPEGTVLLLDVWPGVRGSDPRQLTVAHGRLVFTADDGVHGAELWASDGSAVGTRLVQDLQPGAFPGDPGSFTAAGELVFFNARREETGAELWALPAVALFEPLAAAFDLPPIAVGHKPVVLSDLSTGRPDSWCWRFGDELGGHLGDECSATTPVVEHGYSQPGTYEVTLRVGRRLPDGTPEHSEASRVIEVRPLRPQD